MLYDVSALILTYNPNFEKLIYTLNSFMLQKNIKLQIVIADDGSNKDYFNEIRQYFKERDFGDYKLMCCLKYEEDVYEEKLKRLPKIGAIVKTEDGEGIRNRLG